MIRKNRTTATAEIAIKLRNFMADHLAASQKEVMQVMNIGSEANLYSLLKGFAGDPELCVNGEFSILKDGKRLTIDIIEKFLSENPAQERNTPKPAERLLYLYYCLNNASPDGGLGFDAIRDVYTKLFEFNEAPLPKKGALKRMIYRDISEFQKLQIGIERPETGSKKYCLKDRYLPKLTAESAAAVYVSLLLYRDTLLNEATLGAKEQIEKSFFKDLPERSQLLEKRIYVLGDTLTNPSEFGNMIGKLIRAVIESYRIKINYMNNDGKESTRVVEPLGLVCKRNVWYLIANLVNSNEIRTFRLDQIMNLITHDSEKFIYPHNFSLTDHIGCSWGVFHNDKIQIVKLKFSKRVAHRVKNLRYHPSQRIIEECPDGTVILEFEVCGLVEMQSWILQWGSQVEVLKPLKLRQEIINTAQSILQQYN
ncbi:MAG: WYL domain-containing protein [Syntrophomonadaceae bacterium]|nr:WYL domain-containing protein [Syntrophomonadaceae bacterium]MDD3023911.1 WYL domain-containing protein [Syntrophomonadaceae bacterium]